MLQGLIAAIIALAFITMALYGMKDYLPEMNMSQGNSYIMIVYGSVVTLSLMLTFFSTIFSMRKYLNADIDKFYM